MVYQATGNLGIAMRDFHASLYQPVMASISTCGIYSPLRHSIEDRLILDPCEIGIWTNGRCYRTCLPCVTFDQTCRETQLLTKRCPTLSLKGRKFWLRNKNCCMKLWFRGSTGSVMHNIPTSLLFSLSIAAIIRANIDNS